MKVHIDKSDIFFLPLYFFWVIAVMPKAVQLCFFGVVLMVVVFKMGGKSKIDKFAFLQLICINIYIISVAINTIFGEHETERVLAAINTLLINCIAVTVYVKIFSYEKTINFKKLNTLCLFNLLILVFNMLIYRFTHFFDNISIFGHVLCGADWINGQYKTRFYGFLDYSNLVVFIIFFLYPNALKKLYQNKILATLFTLALFYTVYLTNSRSGLLLFLVVVVSFFLFNYSKDLFNFIQKNKIVVFVLGILAIAILFLIGREYLLSLYNDILNMRNGSNSMRMYIYKSSMNRMIKESPIFGIGIKDMLGNFGYPYGSHSTYIGMLYKTGLVGGTIYIISIIYISIRIIKYPVNNSYDYMQKIALLMIAILMIVEDIDGTAWTVYFLYLFIALFFKNERNNPEDLI